MMQADRLAAELAAIQVSPEARAVQQVAAALDRRRRAIAEAVRDD
jgi:hypothetical protein